VGEVLLERDGSIAWLRMNRPEAHNAFSRDMMALMAERVRELADDRDARVAMCGTGPSFCTGLDVKELARGELEVAFFVGWEPHDAIAAGCSTPTATSAHSARRSNAASMPANSYW
jgi:enoyl-CoA hydratase/carnithine racemase